MGLVCRWHFLCQTCRRVSAIQNMAPVLAALLHVQKMQLAHLRFCVLDHLACADSLISILNAASHREGSSVQTYYRTPIFHPLIWDMLWKPPHSLRAWHVFHAGDGQFWPLPRRVGHCRDTRRIPVWRAPLSVFVSDEATSDDWSHKSECNSRLCRDISAVTSNRWRCKLM